MTRFSNHLLALCLGTLACLSCSAERPGNSSVTEASQRDLYQQYFAHNRDPSPVATLRLSNLYGTAESFGLLADLAVIDSRLVALDSRSALGIVVIDRGDGTIRRVDHPGDALAGVTGPSSVLVGEGKKIWVYYKRAGKWICFDVDSPDGGPVRVLDMPHSLTQPVWMGGRIVANGIFAGELMRMYELDGERTALVGGRGATPFPEATPDMAIHLNRTRLTARPKGDRLALAFRYVSRLHVYDSECNLERALAGPTEVELRYAVVHDPREGIDRFVRTADTRLAYLDVTASDDLIYALFSGRRRGDDPDNGSYGNEIHVFGWDGRLLGVWRLPEDVYRIVLDLKRKSLLGVREAPFPAVLEFELPLPSRKDADPSQTF